MDSITCFKLPCIIVILVSGWMTVRADMIFHINPPGDITLLRGSNLELNCSVDNSSYDVMEMKMRFCHPNKTCIDINESLVTRFKDGKGNSTFTLRKSNLTFEDSGNYECFYGNDFQNIKAVKVGDLPEKPENISCISYNFNGLQCTATLIQKPFDLPMNWTLKYVLDGNTNGSWETQCQDFVVSSQVMCKWGDTYSDPIDSKMDIFSPLAVSYNIKVIVTNRLGSRASSIISFAPMNIDHKFGSHQCVNILNLRGMSSWGLGEVVLVVLVREIQGIHVKPGPVDYLKVSLTDNSYRVEVTWQVNNHLFASNMMLAHRIKLVSLQGWEEPRTMYMRNFKLTRHNKDLILNITDLIPNANYTVSVSSKPEGAIGEQYWSDPVNYTFKTKFSIPGASVAVTNGSFLYIPEEDDTANIVLYWRNPSDKVSHGEINKYKVEIDEHVTVGYNTEMSPEVDELNVTVATLLDDVDDMSKVYMEVLMIEDGIHDEDSHNLSIAFNKSSEYTIKVWAGNNAGFSTETAVIGVPMWAQVKDLLPRWVLAEVDEQSHRTLVSWDDGNGKFENVTMVTVFSCRDTDGMTSSCEDLNWYAENQGSGEMWVNASRGDSVAVSLITNGGHSGGMVWQSLSYAYGKRPSIPLYSVNSDPANPSTLIVTVTHASGDDGRPETFKMDAVRADKLNDPSKCQTNSQLQNYPVDFAKTELVVKGLLPSTEYVVCMKSGNTVGDSPFGRAVVIRTSSDKVVESEGHAAEMIVGGLGFVIICVLLVVCIVCCRRKIKSVKRNNRIKDPEMNFDRSITYQHQNGVMMHGRMFGDEDDDLTKPDNKDSGTESGNASSSLSQNQDDTDKGLVRDRRWSSVSNDSSSSKLHARRRRSSSGISGYLRVDGDTSGVSVENECDSLIDNGADQVDDGTDEQGETNEYFDGIERFARHYEEIEDASPETDTEYTVDDKTYKLSKAVQHESSTYIGNSPPLARLNTGCNVLYDQGGKAMKETSFEDISNDISANPKDNYYVPNENANTQSTLITKSNPYLDNHLDINSLQFTPLSNKDNSGRYSPQYRDEEESVFNDRDSAIRNAANVQNTDGNKGFGVDLFDSNKCNINESSATMQNLLAENQVDNKYESNTEDSRSARANQLINPPVEEINSSGASFDELTSGEFRVEELEDSSASITTSNFDNYQEADKISLGQGSSLTGYIDTYKNNLDSSYTDDENDLPNADLIVDSIDNIGQSKSESDQNSFSIDDRNHDAVAETTDDTVILSMTRKNGYSVPIEKGKQIKSLIETIPVPHESLVEASVEAEKTTNDPKSVNSNSYDSYVCAGVDHSS